MYPDIEKYVKSCFACQQSKPKKSKKAPLHPLPVVNIFERWHIDFLGPYKKSADGKKYILVLIDSMSKWCEAFPIESADSVTVASILFGAMTSLVSDRGVQFLSSLTTELCKLFNVKRTTSSSYHPQSNAQVESLNGVINASLRTYVKRDQSDWPDAIPGIMMAYRKSVANRSTGLSPYFMLFGKMMKTPLDADIIPTDQVAQPFRRRLQTIARNIEISRKVAQDIMRRNQDIYKDQYDKSTAQPKLRQFDMVLISNPQVPVGDSAKLHKPYKGPYVVTELHPNSTYTLRDLHTNKLLPTRIHANRIKLIGKPYESATRRELRRQQRADGSADDSESENKEHEEESDEDGNEEDNSNEKQNNRPERVTEEENEDVHTLNPDTVVQIKQASRCSKTKRVMYKVTTIDNPKSIWVWENYVPLHLKYRFFKNYTQAGKQRKKKLGDQVQPYFTID